MTYQTAREMSAALAAGKVSASELVDQAIARIESLDAKLNAVVVRDFDRARAAARAADAALAQSSESGEMRPLLGVPMTVKEGFNIAGLPTTWGLPGTEGNIAAHDAVAVRRLKAAGAIILGKTNVPTMLMDWQSFNPIHGVTNNPWDLARTPGGSSGGGAAALAAGFVPLEFGSDLGGSLRVPAHFCGTFAHKPTYGIIPMRGFAPPGAPEAAVASGVDFAVAGPMARNAGDLLLGLEATAGPDDLDATGYSLALPPARHARLGEYRVLILDSHSLLPSGTEIRAAFATLAAKLEQAGCRIGRSSAPLPDLERIAKAYGTMLMAFIGSELPEPDYAALRALAESLPPEADGLAAQSQRALVLSHRDWHQAGRIRDAVANQWHAFFRDWDVVLCPIMPIPAFLHDHRPMEKREISIDGAQVEYGRLSMWAGIATLSGQPATAMPLGLGSSGLPIGMQIVGPYLEDRTTIAFAGLIEREFGGFAPPPGY